MGTWTLGPFLKSGEAGAPVALSEIDHIMCVERLIFKK